ncbi:uncharacterized protein N7446_005266 [Penicillium canescens]|uniref:Uncharacterized protein n=1 Tax=Penicillium canescens TaxID=5083 RepID=A0AAD6N8C9_PENCN|nr:uncharacterized protein N7446_005266 [Penicillium canescens]KAJ6038462.1 hypothetical protein N7460_008233 [Penicillium canescens]KAJ6068229.1 hypothetical protein N7446_005266 [Penicillium canescens]
MASTPFSLEHASDAIRDLGFYSEMDQDLRTPMLEMGPKSCLSAEGLEFCKIHVIGDKRARSILESFFPSCGLARYRKFHSDPGHIFQFRSGGEKAGRHVLVVKLWGSGSEVVFFDRSHRHKLPGVHASNGLWEVPFAALESVGCGEGSEILFEHGGLTIQDARLAFEIRKGTPIATVFATPDVIMKWAKVVLPNTPQIAEKAAELQEESAKIGFHFEYDTKRTAEPPSVIPGN